MSLNSSLTTSDPNKTRLDYNAELSDIIADVNNIVSSETGEINLAKSFVNEFDFDDNDFDILVGSMCFNSGMTRFQCEHFVADSQITPWRKVRQALMELETRYHAYMEIGIVLEKQNCLERNSFVLLRI